MDKKPTFNEADAPENLHLPMGQLFYLLRSNGFRVKPDDYIELLKITERFGSENIDETAKWICPIIATTETEQLRFYNIVDQYKKLQSLQSASGATVVEDQVSYRMKWAASVLILLALLLAAFLYFRKENYEFAEELNKERTIEKGSTLSLDATGLLKTPQTDSNHINFNWLFEDGSKQHGPRVSHTFALPGNFYIKREFTSLKLALNKKADSLLIHVCKDLPKVTINVPAAAIIAHQPVNLTASVDADSGTVSFYQWTINDSVFNTKDPLVYNFVFSKEGDVSIECKAVVGSVDAPCTGSDNKVIQVQDNGLHYNAKFSAHTVRVAVSPGLKWWVSLILLVPAAAGLLYSILKREIKKKTVTEKKPADQSQLTKGPYDIPFEQNDIKLIQQERDLRRTFIQMRYKAEEETLALNVQGTIESIIKSGGSPQLVFAPLTKQQQYLVLIDRANPKSLLTRFFGYLARSMADDGIPVVTFYYDKQFNCFNDHFPAGISLQKLGDMYKDATLIIIGKAHQLVYSVYATIEEKYYKELLRWQNKAIITPTPVKDWEAKEKILQQFFILVPADVMALQKLVPALKEKIKPHETLLEITEADQYTIRPYDFREVKDIRNYLNNNEALFQWLCAICIYPRLKWEVLIEIGKAILDKYGQLETLNYSNLLKLCRITWMQEGVFPQSTRLDLLKELTTENEICARETLLHMLTYSTLIYGEKGYFFEEEKKRQQLTNQFVLHASNNVHYKQYAASKETFKALWKNNAILDMPLKKYLDRTSDDNWQTPVSDGNSSVSLSKYFDLHEVSLNKSLQFKRVLMAAASVLLIALWIYLGFGGGASKLSPAISLSKNMADQVIPFSLTVTKNFRNCGDTSKANFASLNGYLEINKQRFPLTYDQLSATVLFSVPYPMLAAGSAIAMLSWDNNKTVSIPLEFKNYLLPDSVAVICMGPVTDRKQQLYIRYNDAKEYAEIQNAVDNALYGYYISALQADFTDLSRIVYYQPNQKPRADSIVQIMKTSLNIDVKEEYIREDRVPEAVPILFLNTITQDSTVPVVEDRPNSTKEEADSYHSMGDQYFTQKQYQKAIEQYTLATGLNPKDDLAFYQTGICYDLLNNTSKAIEAYTSAIELNNKDASYYYSRGTAKYNSRRYAEAITDLSRVIIMSSEVKTKFRNVYYYRGKSYLFNKNKTSACNDFKKAIDLGVSAAKKEYSSNCTIDPAAADPLPNTKSPQTQTVLGNIELDQGGYTDAAGQQVIQTASRLLKAQPQGKIQLVAFYETDAEQKTLNAYINTIIGMMEKIGVNSKTQISKQLNKTSQQLQQQQNAPANKRLNIRVIGINLTENRKSAS